MTTYKEFYQKVLFRLDRSDGRALLAAKDAVNDAHKIIARVKDFDDLLVLDTTNALTVADTGSYHLTSDWGLTRPKDIYTLRYMDEANSRKLTYVSPGRLDEVVPYVEIYGTQKPYYYTRRGMEIELIPIPGEAQSVYVYYSQWPLPLSDDGDETSYANAEIDDVIINLAAKMADAALKDLDGDWESLANSLLTGAYLESEHRPDRRLVAKPFQAVSPVMGEWWKQPFTTRDP